MDIEMGKVRKKFILYAMLAMFTLLTVLLIIINGINFTMASEDADRITQMIADEHGSFKKDDIQDSGKKETLDLSEKESGSDSSEKKNYKRIGPMGPESPEMNASVRYFTFSFDSDGNAKKVAYQVSAVSESEAEKWAKSLINEDTGWTRMTYRYRVYEYDDKTYVTVIDQGRELLPSYRILIISLVGELLVLMISMLLLILVGRKLFNPLEEADRKQKKFISNIESEFKLPLTVINANTEIMEREGGSTEYIKSINRQVRKMTRLVKDLGTLTIFEEKDMKLSKVNLSNIVNSAIDYKSKRFKENNIAIDYEIDLDVIVDADEEAVKKIIDELLENALKFAISKSFISLKKKSDRITIQVTNDTDLPSGSVEQVFDRFSRLENSQDKDGDGLGLSYVKDMVKAHNGRISARVNKVLPEENSIEGSKEHYTFAIQIDL